MTATPQKLSFTAEDWRKYRAHVAGSTPPEPLLHGEEFPDIWLLDQLAHRPKPNWLIRHLLEERGLTTFFGPDKVGKTAMLSQFLWSWVAGHDSWFDAEFEMHDAEDGERSVMYVLLEGQGSFYDRYDAWRNVYDQDSTRLEKFYVMDEGLSIFDQKMRWDDPVTWPESAKRLYAACERLKPKVLVIDTLSRATGGMDENSPQVAQVVSWFDLLRNTFGMATIVVHHVALADDSRPRGHSSLKGATSTYARVTGDPSAKTQKFITGPHRNAETFNPTHGNDYGWIIQRRSHRGAFVIEPGKARPKTKLDEIVEAVVQAPEPFKATELGKKFFPDSVRTIYGYIKPENGLYKRDGYVYYEPNPDADPVEDL